MEQTTAPRPATLPSSGHPLGLVDLAGICELLRVSRSSAERLIKNDPLPAPVQDRGPPLRALQDLQEWVSQKAKPEFVA